MKEQVKSELQRTGDAWTQCCLQFLKSFLTLSGPIHSLWFQWFCQISEWCCHCSEIRNELSIVPHLSLHVSVLEMNRTCFFFLYLVRTGNDLMASILSLRDSSTPSNIAHVHVSTLWHCNLTLWRFHWQTSLLQFLSSSYRFRSSSHLSSLLTLALFLSSWCLFSCFLDY